jgi:septum formation protein
MPSLVLASTSPYRRALLDRLRVPYQARAHRCDERALEPHGAGAEDVALTLARAKAGSLVADASGAHVLGSDQIVELDGAFLHKPGTAEAAVAQLLHLAGRTHRIVTAVALCAPDGRVDTHVDVHLMTMRALPRDVLERYVARDNPIDCAGSYKIESDGYFLFDAVLGRDHTAVIGLPLLATAAMLARAGFAVPPGA